MKGLSIWLWYNTRSLQNRWALGLVEQCPDGAFLKRRGADPKWKFWARAFTADCGSKTKVLLNCRDYSSCKSCWAVYVASPALFALQPRPTQLTEQSYLLILGQPLSNTMTTAVLILETIQSSAGVVWSQYPVIFETPRRWKFAIFVLGFHGVEGWLSSPSTKRPLVFHDCPVTTKSP